MQSDPDTLQRILQTAQEGEKELHIGDVSHILFYKKTSRDCEMRTISESVSGRLHLKQWHQQGESQTSSLLFGCEYFGSSSLNCPFLVL